MGLLGDILGVVAGVAGEAINSQAKSLEETMRKKARTMSDDEIRRGLANPTNALARKVLEKEAERRYLDY